jgi:hypothetical protein
MKMMTCLSCFLGGHSALLGPFWSPLWVILTGYPKENSFIISFSVFLLQFCFGTSGPPLKPLRGLRGPYWGKLLLSSVLICSFCALWARLGPLRVLLRKTLSLFFLSFISFSPFSYSLFSYSLFSFFLPFFFFFFFSLLSLFVLSFLFLFSLRLFL